MPSNSITDKSTQWLAEPVAWVQAQGVAKFLKNNLFYTPFFNQRDI